MEDVLRAMRDQIAYSRKHGDLSEAEHLEDWMERVEAAFQKYQDEQPPERDSYPPECHHDDG